MIIIQHDSSMIYKNSKFLGKYYKGKKVGQWADQTADGIIYSENWYDSIGEPTGIWKNNFPDGNPRYTTEYSNNSIIKFTIYRYKRKLAEVLPDKQIPDTTYLQLVKFESGL
jgi:hypothetical protein